LKKIKVTAFILGTAYVIFNAVFFWGCNSENTTAPTGTNSFSQDIYPVFAQNCTFPACHNSIDKQAGIDLTSWNAIMLNGSDYGAEIIPYNAKWSHLVQHINRDTNIGPVSEPQMPKAQFPYTTGASLPSNIVQRIMQWIDEGAQNDFGAVAYSNITRKAFITNQSSDYIAVVNLDNNFVTRLIKAGNGTQTNISAPHIIIADNEGKYFYVSLIKEGYIEKFDVKTYQKLGRMAAGSSPAHIVITNNGRYGYFSNFDISTSNPEKYIKKFDTETMTVTDTITEFRMTAPHGLRLTHDGSLLITATQSSEFVYVIRSSDNVIEDIIPVDKAVPPNGNGTGSFVPYQIAITPDDRYALISCSFSNDVRVLDLQTRIILPQHIPVGFKPLALEISPDGRWCYVPNQGSNSVTVIDLQSLAVAKTITDAGAQPHQIDFTEDGHYAYVTCESRSGPYVHHPVTGSYKPGTTTVIDVWNGHVKIRDIEMASFPAGISIIPGKGN